ncbi:MAG: low molecular weight phosphatase family protein [Caulobacteraceae bacterium]|jgi:protein-tyrosine-phosphatase|nr:low molecular weight phosphatase family protein [Caulobacteraceae bacterium]
MSSLDRLPGAVLFACNFNKVRSPMAEALLKRAYGTAIFVDSCGLKADATDPGMDPFAAAVLEELGIETASHRPKTFDQLEDDSFDVVISLTAQAQHRAVELSRGRAVEIEYWPTLDPTLATGSRDQMLDAYRQVRDELYGRIRRRFGRVLTAGG